MRSFNSNPAVLGATAVIVAAILIYLIRIKGEPASATPSILARTSPSAPASSGKPSMENRTKKERDGTSIDAHPHMDSRVEHLLSNYKHIQIFDGTSLTKNSQSLLNLDNITANSINLSLSKAKSSLTIEYKSRVRQIDSQDESVTIYRIDAFPERSLEIREQVRREIAGIAGKRLADLAANSLLASPTSLGFGANDLLFKVSKAPGPADASPSEPVVWLIRHEEYLPGTTKLVSHNNWRADDFISLCGIFEEMGTK